MKNNKLDAALLWKQLDQDVVPRLGLDLAERVVNAQPENPRNRKAWPLLPKLARRKKGRHSPALKSNQIEGGEFAFDDREHRFYFGAWRMAGPSIR